ncbi:DNA adenine methylase [Tumebacillus sp. BK434]|uniref:Dam family site-specific DNA-(adenine-N6)-methyltransferase n=1 Tax=Tumebacillus sp. BK434 TaxID=2512169 RepID=UPI0010452E08|nr:DNA adenine methylase [Tumebacillus sp. BK434]TCP52559.1 DNA adenine methylase [Tumebacillus sp. BK434]
MTIPHPIPYQGSKRQLAEKILQYFPSEVETLIEPFAGSAAITLAAAQKSLAKHFVINDINQPLMELWKEIIQNPSQIAKCYEEVWNEQLGKERDYYDLVRVRFNRYHQPTDLLYLLARCVKAAVRYNSKGEFNQGADNRRKGRMPSKMKKDILEASKLLYGRTVIHSLNFLEVAMMANDKDLVYMDPPYQGVNKGASHRYISGLDSCEFIDALDMLNKNNISYILSYDGRTGTKVFGEMLPSHLELMHVEIEAGTSSQSTLLGKNDITFESLYLSPALIKRMDQSEYQKQLQLSL